MADNAIAGEVNMRRILLPKALRVPYKKRTLDVRVNRYWRSKTIDGLNESVDLAAHDVQTVRALINHANAIILKKVAVSLLLEI
jgi:hypothetical protein